MPITKWHRVRLALVLTVLLMACSAFFLVPTRSVKADPANDYPSDLATAAQDSMVDPWGFYNRECTSFVAWRLNNNNGTPFQNNNYEGKNGHFGMAYNWGSVAASIGLTVDNTPAVGAVAWWYWPPAKKGDSPTGHVAWVAAVNTDGSVQIQDYNRDYDGTFHDYKLTSAPTGYIHFKDLSGSSATPTPPPVPWNFENMEGGSGAISPHVGNVGKTPTSIVFNGRLYVFYYDVTGGTLRVAYTNPNWVFDVVDGSGGVNGKTLDNVGQVPHAVVFNNTLYVFYYDASNGGLRMAWTYDGTHWFAETLDGGAGSVSGYGGNVGQTPVAIVYGNLLEVFYYQPDQGLLRHAWSSDGGHWNFETLDGNVNAISHLAANVGLNPTAVVVNGTLQLFYYDISQGDLRHAWADASGWHFENLDGDSNSVGHIGQNVGSNPTAFVYQGNLHVLYYDKSAGTLRHAWSDQSGWHFETLAGDAHSVLSTTPTDTGTMTTAVVNGNTLQVFAYQAGTHSLTHIWNDSNGWHQENLDGLGGQPASREAANVGTDPTAIMFGSTLEVFYYDVDHGALRHAWPQS